MAIFLPFNFIFLPPGPLQAGFKKYSYCPVYLIIFLKTEHAVMAAEPEGIGYCSINGPAYALIRYVIQITFGIRFFQISCCRKILILYRHNRYHTLNTAGASKEVACHGFG